jgi:hypothetical protein
VFVRAIRAKAWSSADKRLAAAVANPYSSRGRPLRLACSLRLAEFYDRFKCCPDSHSMITIFNTCLAMFCTSTTYTATAYPSHSLVIFCARLTLHHSLSCPVSHCTPPFPYAFLTASCPFWHVCCIATEFECLPLPRLPEVMLESPRSVLSEEPKSTPI